MRSLVANFLIWTAVSSLLISCAGDHPDFPGKTGVGFKAGFGEEEIQAFQTEARREGKRPLIFVHGSPGKAAHWSRYFDDPELSEKYRLVAYDRPGYGNSKSGFVDFDRQVDALAVLLKEQSRPATLVGHSLSGAIVLAAAARYPDKVHEVVALAPSVDTKPGFVLKMNRLLRNSGLGWLLVRPWRVSHLEVLAVYPALRRLQPELGQITAPVTVVQGGRDKLVPATSVAYLKKYLTATSPRIHLLENEGHFLPWERDGLVKRILLGKANPGERVLHLEK